MAVLFALANPTPAHVILAIAALAKVGPADLRRLYWSFLSQELSPTLEGELEIDMDPEKIRSLLEHYTELNATKRARWNSVLARQRLVVRRALDEEGRLDEHTEQLLQQADDAKVAEIVVELVDHSASAYELLTRQS